MAGFSISGSTLQLRGLLSRLVNGCDTTLDDEAGHLSLPNVHISLCGVLQKALFRNLQGSPALPYSSHGLTTVVALLGTVGRKRELFAAYARRN